MSELLDFVARWLPPPPARVVEIGCGEGALTQHLISAGFDAVGIDPQAPAGDHFERIEVEYFTPAERFDAAVAVRSLHHVADLERAVASLHAMIRPRGRLVLCEFALEHLDEAARRWLTERGLGDALDYDHSGVIPLGELERALAERFRPLCRDPTPYMATMLEREDLLAAERRAIAAGTIRPVGMELVYENRY